MSPSAIPTDHESDRWTATTPWLILLLTLTLSGCGRDRDREDTVPLPEYDAAAPAQEVTPPDTSR